MPKANNRRYEDVSGDYNTINYNMKVEISPKRSPVKSTIRK